MVRSEKAEADDLLAGADKVSVEIEQANQLAVNLKWVDSDNKLASSVEQLRQLVGLLRTAAVRKVKDQASALDNRLNSLAGAGNPQEQLAAVGPIASEVQLLRRFAGISDDAKSAIDAVADRLEKTRNLLTQGLNQIEVLRAIRNRATSVSLWSKEMKDYIARFPDAPISKEFSQSLEAIAAASSIESLRDLLDGWSGQLAPTSEAMARERLDRVKQYLKDYPLSPYVPSLNAYAAYLTEAADALALKSSWQVTFQELLSTPLLSELRYVTISDGSRYYVIGDVHQTTRGLNDRAYVTFEAIDPGNLAKRKVISVTPPQKLVTDKPELAPHVRFVENLNMQMRQIGPENWDSFGISVIDQLLKDKEMDLTVKAILLQQTLQATSKVAGWGLAGLYDRTLSDLARQQVESIVWYDFEHPIAPAVLEALKKIMDAMPRPQVAADTLADRRGKLFQSLQCNLVGEGTLLRDEAGTWAIYTRAAADTGSVALAFNPLTQSSQRPRRFSASRDVKLASGLSMMRPFAIYPRESWFLSPNNDLQPLPVPIGGLHRITGTSYAQSNAFSIATPSPQGHFRPKCRLRGQPRFLPRPVGAVPDRRAGDRNHGQRSRADLRGKGRSDPPHRSLFRL